MRFWDSSALLPLFVVERTSPRLRELIALDNKIVVWSFTLAELLSGIWRREPAAHSDADRAAAARVVTATYGNWLKVTNVRAILAASKNVARRHRLRAGDTIQLSAALVASRAIPAKLSFVTLDRELASAARAEGFPVLP